MKVVILTGAGISAESGIPTFRGPDGLWEGHRLDEVATPQAFRAAPEMVLRFYNQRRQALLAENIRPNPAHLALVRLAEHPAVQLTLVTQNIDDLHERAGSTGVLHMHGELLKARCTGCGGISEIREDMTLESLCPLCSSRGRLRPDVVWFGEMPYYLDRIPQAVAESDLFVSIGTSGVVYPAAGFVSAARSAGVRTLEINLDESATTGVFSESRRGAASVETPRWVGELLADLG